MKNKKKIVGKKKKLKTRKKSLSLRAKKSAFAKATAGEAENPDSLFNSSTGKTNSLFVSNLDKNI